MVRRSIRWRQEAERLIQEAGGFVEPGGECGAPKRKHNVPEGSTATRCQLPAGLSTAHHGFGLCQQHGGNTKKNNAIGAWMMAHALARPLGINPWEALLGEVRRTAGGGAWLDLKISEAGVDGDLIGAGAIAPWVRMRERE